MTRSDAAPGAPYYRSGDLGRRTEDGDIEYLGRIDTQIQLRGFRIELGEIEAAVLAHPSIGACAVCVREDVAGEPQLVVYMVAEHGHTIDIAATREHLRMRFPEYMVPNIFVELPALPLTTNGKLDRDALPAPQLTRESAGAAYVVPAAGLEGALARLWTEVLGIDDIGAEDNFFDVGGHSMLLAQVHSRIVSELGKQVAIVDLFRHPTIRSLAAFLEQKSTLPAATLEGVDETLHQRREQLMRRRRLAQSSGRPLE